MIDLVERNSVGLAIKGGDGQSVRYDQHPSLRVKSGDIIGRSCHTSGDLGYRFTPRRPGVGRIFKAVFEIFGVFFLYLIKTQSLPGSLANLTQPYINIDLKAKRLGEDGGGENGSFQVTGVEGNKGLGGQLLCQGMGLFNTDFV